MDPLTANLITTAIAIGLVVLAVTIVLFRRHRGSATGALTVAESVTVSIVGGGAILVSLGSILGLYTNAVWLFDVEPFHVTGLHFAGVTTPALLEGVDHVAASGYEGMWIDVMRLPSDVRWLFYAETVLPLVVTLAISIVVAWLSFTLGRERPFARAFPVGIGIAAIAVMVGGLGAQFAGAIARSGVIDYLGASQLIGDDTSAPAYDVLSYFWLKVDLAPVGWAFGLILVAAAFQIGTRLQREADLLV